MVSGLCSRLCCSDCDRFCPRNDIRFPWTSSARLEFVIVPSATVFGQSFGPYPIHSQPTGNFWNEEGGFCQCWSSRYGYQWIWTIRTIKLVGHWIFLSKSWGGIACCLQTKDRYFFHQQPSTTWRRKKEYHPKTPLCWIKSKTRRTLLQQLQCLSVPLNLPCCSDVVLLENGL